METIEEDLNLLLPRLSNSTEWLVSCLDIPPCIQKGPTCGLVALHLVSTFVRRNTTCEVENMLEIAREKGFSKQGELFSCECIASLAREQCGLGVDIWQDWRPVQVITHLGRGLPLLIPYDADFNYEPCLREGDRAHWSALIGFAVPHKMMGEIHMDLRVRHEAKMHPVWSHVYLHIVPEAPRIPVFERSKEFSKRSGRVGRHLLTGMNRIVESQMRTRSLKMMKRLVIH
mmetsp:Transcript_8727/g.14304  ORF Transcript_8727/g.14304 Transcript_8727/m.14304 type:complete len:230 (-) Transcript_8727:84-773(-)